MIGIAESGRRALRARERERGIFEAVGRWVPTERDLRAKLLFAQWSRHHAWHAELWNRVVPVLHDVVLDGAPEVVDEARAVLGPATNAGTASRLDAYAAEVDAFATLLVAWRAEAGRESDGPFLRVARIVGEDLAAARDDASAVRQALAAADPL